MTLSALILIACAVAVNTVAAERFIDHGIGGEVAESRGVVTTQDAEGNGLVIACSLDHSPRGWILVTNIDTGETEQIYYPEGVPNSPPFASLMSSNGRFYTGAGRFLLEFDPATREWLFHGVPHAQAQLFVDRALADGPDGLIWGGTYPNAHLFSFNPETKEFTDYGQMEPEEKYMSHLAFDDFGWVYIGFGTARCNIIAFHPETGERRQLVPEEERKRGTSQVLRGVDGHVYGHAVGPWYRISDGAATEVERAEVAAQEPNGTINWPTTRGTFPDGRRLVNYRLPERWLEVRAAEGDEVTRVEFDYESAGAFITSLVAGPDDRIYGSTNHPMRFFRYDPAEDELVDLGPVPLVGGGNFCALASQGPYIAAPAYGGGWFYLFDTREPFNGGEGDNPNPRIMAQYSQDIARPRVSLAHPDGVHVIMSGFMGYGLRGGGLAWHNLETDEGTLLTHEQVIPDQSTVTLRAFRDGNLVGGTSIQTPGGGHPTATEGVLYLMDWETKAVTFQTVPVPGAPEVYGVEVGPDGLVYGIATGSRFFVFDPQSREVIHRAELAEYGSLPRQTLQVGPDGNIYAVLSGAILRIEPGTFNVERLGTPPAPITAGLPILDGRLYFAARSRLWSYDLGL